jgi:hypothetical protein
MANKIVLYKLIPFGKGFIKPAEVINGGRIWEQSNNIEDTIFVGEIELSKGEELPEGVVEIINKTKYAKHFKELSEVNLRKLKKEIYSKHIDPYFVEALRKKELGDDTKLKLLHKRAKKIKSLKSSYELESLEFNDGIND